MIKCDTIGDVVVFECCIDGAIYVGVVTVMTRMAWQGHCVEGPQSTGSSGPTVGKNDGVLKPDSDVVCSEDGGAAMATELSNGKERRRLEERKNSGC
jgi:hypothetical protein